MKLMAGIKYNNCGKWWLLVLVVLILAGQTSCKAGDDVSTPIVIQVAVQETMASLSKTGTAVFGETVEPDSEVVASEVTSVPEEIIPSAIEDPTLTAPAPASTPLEPPTPEVESPPEQAPTEVPENPTPTPTPFPITPIQPTLLNDNGGVGMAEFAMSNAITTTPQDVLAEIWYIVGAGGMSVCWGSEESPGRIGGAEFGELHQHLQIESCGWQEGEEVQILVTHPSGQVLTENQVVESSSGRLAYDFQADILRDDPGLYTLTFQGPSGIATHTIEISRPVGARLIWNDDGTLILTGFEPREQVRLFVYTISEKNNPDAIATLSALEAWQLFQVDQNGQLLITPSFDPTPSWYAVVSDFSGVVHPDYWSSPEVEGIYLPPVILVEGLPTPTPVPDINRPEACPLVLGGSERVLDNSRLWSQPDVSVGSVMTTLELGTEITIAEGPVWGPIRADINTSGWWWAVTADSNDPIGWLWEERIEGCVES